MNSNRSPDPQHSEATVAASLAHGDVHQRVLGSWKEIAQFLGKSVRTVQRWECERGLPVHRPSMSLQGVVIALPEELESWARNPSLFQHTTSGPRMTSVLIAGRARALRQAVERMKVQCLRACSTVADLSCVANSCDRSHRTRSSSHPMQTPNVGT